MRRLILLTILAASLSGCGQAPATLAGGKPVSYWVQALRDPDAGLRKKAVVKLGNVGPADPAVLPALLRALNDPDAAVRRDAILALMKCGPSARDAMPTLRELQHHDPDAQVRAYAGKALQALQSDRDPSPPG